VETIPVDREIVKVNFKATVVPKEDLYRVDREMPGRPPVTLLQVVQSAGTELSVYGYLEAHHILDDWTLNPPQFEVGFDQFGKPRGAFDAQSYLTGSEEANAALAQQAANAAEQERIIKVAQDRREAEEKAMEERQARADAARQAREEQDRLALEQQRQIALEQQRKEDEQRQEEAAAVRQKLILATLPGTAYIGTLSYRDQRQALRLVFIEQDGFLVRAEVNNPDNPREKQIFTGELIFDGKPEEQSGVTYPAARGRWPGPPLKPEEQSGVAYPIKMSPVHQAPGWEHFEGKLDVFYYAPDVPLKLSLTDTGLEGEAVAEVVGQWDNSRDTLAIRLEREEGPRATPPARPGPSAAAPTSAPSGLSDADKAAYDLSVAKDYLAFKRYDAARSRLQAIVDTYPTTPAADEARRLLNDIEGK
jgi:biotin carboxyl carrier protein